MAINTFFDFHIHPLFKQFLSNYEEVYPSDRSNTVLSEEIVLSNELLRLADNAILHILGSQCSVSQLEEGGSFLCVANIVSLELGVAASKNLAGQLLRSALTRPLDARYFNEISKGSLSYYQLLLKELDLYRKLNGEKVKILSRKHPGDLDEMLQATGLPLMALSIEGGHNLSRLKIGRPAEPDRVKDIEDADAAYKDFVNHPELRAAESLQHLFDALWEDDLDLVYLTLTHLTHIQEQPLATHAYGMKFLHHSSFYPAGNGLTEEGKKVIDTAYNLKITTVEGETKQTPVLIDIKHMSLKSRLDFYKYRSDNNYKWPIVATHMGVTGYTQNEWELALREGDCTLYKEDGVMAVEITTDKKFIAETNDLLKDKEFFFNPWSINLMDEDILEVMNSDGLIGISLDVRILGFEPMIKLGKRDAPEYLSLPDFKTFFPEIPLSGMPTAASEMAMVQEGLLPTKKEGHPLSLCFNILHVAAVGALNNVHNHWDLISIGSDFDGLVDPVKMCKSSASVNELEKNLLSFLPKAEEKYCETFRVSSLLPHINNNKNNPVDQEKLKILVRKIMYENGRNFLTRWQQCNFSRQKLSDAGFGPSDGNGHEALA
ncbi:hypothetical protein SAMN05518672_10423 [Chitinophaga sp. CF118]|uniref:hypothetical protein n=1 Tax=Chitinophaga sp. CF118 TaxID=1884367 RepID=UPI0008F1716E|nr:hypothetical protein [Chitinophaga sp. CF118]SFD98132.1 hypothetical protein SAMN05518672_10423 [Chitinophaga sp. CF118]